MRNAVAGFSIMWVYKRRAVPSRVTERAPTEYRRSHTFSRLRTLGRARFPGPSLRTVCSVNPRVACLLRRRDPSRLDSPIIPPENSRRYREWVPPRGRFNFLRLLPSSSLWSRLAVDARAPCGKYIASSIRPSCERRTYGRSPCRKCRVCISQKSINHDLYWIGLLVFAITSVVGSACR